MPIEGRVPRSWHVKIIWLQLLKASPGGSCTDTDNFSVRIPDCLISTIFEGLALHGFVITGRYMKLKYVAVYFFVVLFDKIVFCGDR